MNADRTFIIPNDYYNPKTNPRFGGEPAGAPVAITGALEQNATDIDILTDIIADPRALSLAIGDRPREQMPQAGACPLPPTPPGTPPQEPQEPQEQPIEQAEVPWDLSILQFLDHTVPGLSDYQPENRPTPTSSVYTEDGYASLAADFWRTDSHHFSFTGPLFRPFPNPTSRLLTM
jgi:hypothetical protein